MLLRIFSPFSILNERVWAACVRSTEVVVLLLVFGRFPLFQEEEVAVDHRRRRPDRLRLWVWIFCIYFRRGSLNHGVNHT